MNPNLITSICRDLLTAEDQATASTLQAGVESLETQRSIYYPAQLADAAERARLAYAENPTLACLKAYEDALVLEHTRRTISRPVVGAVESALDRFHAERVAPWQLAIVNRILPAARLLREKLFAEEKARGMELIGRAMETSDVIVEADLIVRRLEEMLQWLPLNRVTPRDFLRRLHAAPSGETGAENPSHKIIMPTDDTVDVGGEGQRAVASVAMAAPRVDETPVEHDDGPVLAR